MFLDCIHFVEIPLESSVCCKDIFGHFVFWLEGLFVVDRVVCYKSVMSGVRMNGCIEGERL